ncbi:hypothetical protein [Mucilaginibacter sp. UYCu711]|uniref:hypothetical protein n=1 Tax=Mucilaginibacter sp. UYCu711 TaxID=3156339 RepID=UPI003D2629E6
MIFKIALLFFLTIPLCSIAQKAYETANYSGKIKGQTITLKLANGYIGASEISLRRSPKAKPVLYAPDSGTPDSDNKISFKSDKATAGYFIVKNMQDAYDRLPVIIYVIFITGTQSLPVKLTLDRNKI